MDETLTSEGRIKSMVEDRRDKLKDIEMLLKELEEGRGIINEEILTIRKGFL